MSADDADRFDDDRVEWWTIVVDAVTELRSSKTSREIGAEISRRLSDWGYEIVSKQDDVAPVWAEVLMDALFTGSRLDYGHTEIPGWLQRRLEAEFGMPLPTGEQATRHAAPVDLDHEYQPTENDLIVEESESGSGNVDHGRLP